MNNVFVLQLTMLLLIVIGVIIKKTGIISPIGQKNINDLVIYLILPCNIIKSFLIEWDHETLQQFALVLIISIAIQIVSVILGKVLYGKKELGHRMSLQYGVICSNAGFLGTGGRRRVRLHRSCHGQHFPDSHANHDVVLGNCDLYPKHRLERHVKKSGNPSLYHRLFRRSDSDADPGSCRRWQKKQSPPSGTATPRSR